MENSNIHKSLLELEGSLKDLQSARNQVDSFSFKSEQMIETFTKILHHLDSLQTKFEKENAQLLTYLSQKYEKVYNTISSKSTTLEAKSDEYITKLSSSYNYVVEKVSDLEYCINDAKEKINQIDFIKSLGAVETKLNEINKSILFFNKDLAELRKSINYNLQTESSKNSNNYTNLVNKIDDLFQDSNKISQLTANNFKNQNNNITELAKKVDTKIDWLFNANEKNVSCFTEKTNSLEKQIRLIGVALLVGILILAVLIFFK